MNNAKFPVCFLLFSLCFITLECRSLSKRLISSSAGLRCPHGWVRYGTEKCIRVYQKATVSQDEAESRCNSERATLSSIHSSHELEFVKSYLLKTIPRENLAHIWVGLKRVESKWFWLDLSPFDYADWYPGYPAALDHQLGCGSLATGHWNLKNDPPHFGKINDAGGVGGCGMKIPYICQIYFADL